MYMLQDANYNIVALTDGSGNVLEQYAWEPYGTQAATDTMATPAPDNRVGHQGLFYYGFGTSGLYYNRNRWYSPTLGRFTTKDPNETALAVVGAMVSNGRVLYSLIESLDGELYYDDGLNLYGRARCNPLRWTDSSGLLVLQLVDSVFGANLQSRKAQSDLAAYDWVARGMAGVGLALFVAIYQDAIFEAIVLTGMMVHDFADFDPTRVKHPSSRWWNDNKIDPEKVKEAYDVPHGGDLVYDTETEVVGYQPRGEPANKSVPLDGNPTVDDLGNDETLHPD
jgi:RHS repeat-associated protein